MENLNETDGGQLTSNQEIDPAIVKDMYDGFLQFQSSFNIPKEIGVYLTRDLILLNFI